MDEQTVKAFATYLQEGGSIAELHGIGAEQLDALYGFGHQRFAAGEIETARQLFMAVAVIDCRRFDAWMGLGLCYQRQQCHAQALFCLARASLLRVVDPRPVLACAASLRCIGKAANARKAYDMTIRLCGKQPQFAALRTQATAALSEMEEE